jgi:hypothetical protein
VEQVTHSREFVLQLDYLSFFNYFKIDYHTIMLPSQHIKPKYKLILTYNIKPDKQDQYYRYMLGDFVPAIQKMGVYMHMAWNMAYGDYPMRKIEFVTETADALQQLFLSTEWEEMETKLNLYISDYERKVVDYRNGFQL